LNQSSEELQAAVKAALSKNAQDLLVLDIKDISSFADSFIIATGTSNRHIKTLVESIEDALKAMSVTPLSIEGLTEAKWVLMDYGNLIVHIFDEESRSFYDLPKLWSDASEIQVELSTK
jgi:ribosome-associated protein